MNFKNDCFVKIPYDFSATITSVNRNISEKLDGDGLTKVTASRPPVSCIYRTTLTLASRISAMAPCKVCIIGSGNWCVSFCILQLLSTALDVAVVAFVHFLWLP